MKIGDYVRYKKLIYHNQGVDDIRISKIKDIEDAIETGYNQIFIFFENGNGEYEDRIIKSSPNIIDLIEEHDILKIEEQKGVYTICEVEEFRDPYVNYKFLGVRLENQSRARKLYELNIKSIVTKEQFESMEYKVGE